MQASEYESVLFPDPDLPVIFHLDTLCFESKFTIHWQDNLELLYFIEGEAKVQSGALCREFHTGDLAVINNSHLHNIQAVTPVCRYYCLLAEREFCQSLGAATDELCFCLRVHDPVVRQYFDQIVTEMLTKKAYYQAAVRANLGGLFVHLCRNWLEEADFQNATQDKRLYMVKTAIRYIREHMTENLTVESISAAVGFSKYYFCRTFKEMTGQTVINYINAARCGFARWLLLSGRYNVTEAAEQSGFANLSYFTKNYKKYMGQLPSQVGRQSNESDSTIMKTIFI